MQVKTYKTRVFIEGEDLPNFIFKYVKNLKEGSVLVVTSKIIALAEGRVVEMDSKVLPALFRERLIKKESQFALQTKRTWLTIKDGMVMASAGIDESNADGKIILLPKDSFKSAEVIRRAMMKKFKIKKLGVLVTDSRLFPLRAGIVGVALGYAGFKGMKDYRGTPDIFGRVLKVSRTDIADSLATSAVVCMGEGKERQPLAVITDAPVEFINKVNKKELLVDPREDIYQPLFASINKIKKIKKMKFKSWDK